MRVRALAATVAAALAAAGRLAAGEAAPTPYAEAARTAHLQRALDALRALGDAGGRALDREIYAAVRARCRPAGSRPPATSCMIAAARAVCDRRADPAGCAAAADIALTNQHAEPDLLDEPTRIRLVRTSADYHAAVLGELRARHALLAAELALAAPDADAAAIDRFCVARDRAGTPCAPGAALCVPSLPWQRCVAGLIWFLSTSGGAP